MTKSELTNRIEFLTNTILSDTEILKPKYGPNGDLVTRVFNIVKNGKEGLASVEMWDNKLRSLNFQIGDFYKHIDIRTITDSLQNLKINQLRKFLPLLESFVYGRGVEVKDDDVIMTDDNKFTLLNGRIEAGMYDLAPVLQRFNKINEKMGFVVSMKSYTESTSVMGSSTWEVWLDESKMNLMSLKKELDKVSSEKKVDIHILIGSLDYSQFQGLRDRNSPQPKRN